MEAQPSSPTTRGVRTCSRAGTTVDDVQVGAAPALQAAAEADLFAGLDGYSADNVEVTPVPREPDHGACVAAWAARVRLGDKYDFVEADRITQDMRGLPVTAIVDHTGMGVTTFLERPGFDIETAPIAWLLAYVPQEPGRTRLLGWLRHLHHADLVDRELSHQGRSGCRSRQCGTVR